MKFARVEIPDLVAALHQRGFTYIGPGWRGWMKFTGELKLKSQSHACELAVSPRLDEIPRVWLTQLPVGRHEIRPHLSANGYLCYLALDSVIFDFFDPIGQTLRCLERAEDVLESILTGEMTEDLAEEFHATWGDTVCLVDVNEGKLGVQEAYSFGLKRVGVVTDDKARTRAKLEAIGGGLPPSMMAAVRVRTASRPMPLQRDWPPKTVQAFLQWQSALDPACRKKIENQLLRLYQRKAARALVIIESPVVQYGFDVEFKPVNAQPGKPTPLREAMYRLPIHPVSVYRIDDKYIAERNLPGGRTLAGLRIVLVGCGTIGGYLAEMLVKAGAGTASGQLTLVDMGSMEPNNLGRHRLGFPALLKRKAVAMREELQRVAPGANVVDICGDAKNAVLGQLNLLIDATGEQGLTDWLTWRYAANTPFLAAWVEGAGLAVRALLKASAKHACSRCISRPPLAAQYRVFDTPPDIIIRGHGCEGLYVPFPASASIQAAALAMEMVQAWVDNADSPTFRTRVLDQSRAVQFKDCSPPRHEGCPACGT